MKPFFRTCLLFFTAAAISAFTGTAFSQPAAKGPVCVTPGITYDYYVSGDRDAVREITVCISGGSFTSSKSTCITIKPHSAVQVIWAEDTRQARLALSSGDAKNSLQVTITPGLRGGIVDTTRRKQFIRYDTLASGITCSPPTGGYCSPVYIYQWQWSADAVNWKDIDGETGPSLPFRSNLKETVFYRRRVTEKISGSIAYSNAATVFVDVDYKSHQRTTTNP